MPSQVLLSLTLPTIYTQTRHPHRHLRLSRRLNRRGKAPPFKTVTASATMSPAATPSRQAVLGLFRGLLRVSGRLEDYNFRSYARRRVSVGFRENRELAGESLAVEYQDGLQQLEMLKRQAVVSHLYPSKRSVMEAPGSTHGH